MSFAYFAVNIVLQIELNAETSDRKIFSGSEAMFVFTVEIRLTWLIWSKVNNANEWKERERERDTQKKEILIFWSKRLLSFVLFEDI